MKTDEPKKDTPDFVRENIIKKPNKWKRRLLKLAAVVCFAVLFGLIASVVIAWTNPYFNTWFEETLVTTREPISLPKDTEPEPTQMVSTTAAEASGESVTEPSSEAPGGETQTPDEVIGSTPEDTEETAEPTRSLEEIVSEAVERALETWVLTKEDYKRLEAIKDDIISEANRSIVSISIEPKSEEIDPEAVIEETSGAIWEVKDNEIFILANSSVLNKENYVLMVKFSTGVKVEAKIKKADNITKIAILTVPASELDEITLGTVKTITLGSSYSVKAGDTVFAVGSPAGHVLSVTEGRIAYIQISNPGIDSDYRKIFADITVVSNGSGFLINTNSEIVGIILNSDGSEDGSLVGAIGISDLKSVIERLANGRSIPYLGIEGIDITEAISASEGIPAGVYVVNIENNGNSGAYSILDNGDIITAIDDEAITSMRDLQLKLESYNEGDTIKITYQRQTPGEYIEQISDIVLGAR